MNFQAFSIKQRIILIVVGLVVLAGIGALIYFGSPQKEITEPVEITAEQKAKVEASIVDLQSKLKTCDEQSEDNKCSLINIQLGLNYESLGLVSRAIVAYEIAASKNPNFYIPYSNLGSIYRRLKDYTKAEEFFKKAISITPNNPSVYTKLIEMRWLDQRGAPHEVDPIFQQAFKDTNYDQNIIRLYAYYGEKINDPLTAIAAWKSILQFDPNNATAKQGLEKAEKSAREQGLLP
jgi:tetratricopeptide (TPR) repeat protein